MSLYSPLAPTYLDPADARAERDRTFQVCSDCRVCVKLCPSFRSLFEMIDANEDGAHDVKVLTDSEHERVIDECYQCKLCYVICPYTPEREQEWVVDFPRLMLRSLAIQGQEGKVSTSAKLLARTDLQGQVATRFAPLVNAMSHVGAARTVIEKVTGISRVRLLPEYARVRFSKWFRDHAQSTAKDAPSPDAPTTRATVALFPTCMVEYQEASIGRALVGVYERNRIACELPEGEVCCGMPWLDAGDVAKFREHAEKNVALLAPQVRAGRDVVVPQPTCAYVLKNEYPDFLGTDDAQLVADHTFDTSEYLLLRHKEEPLDTAWTGSTYDTIMWQAACHYRAQQIGPKSKQLIELTGAKVTMVERCSAIDGTWGLRAENIELAKRVAKPLMEKVRESSAELIVGDCHLSNTAIKEQAGKAPVHPLQVMARAYGIESE